MAENSGIVWTDHTFNPWTGCTKVSAACDHCYAEGWAKRSGHVEWGPHGSRRRTKPGNWAQPLKWNAEAREKGVRYRVFCASLADVFDNHGSITSGWRGDLWSLIHRTPHLDWLLLTKRPQNIAKMLPESYGMSEWGDGWPNVWLGTTVENQTEASRRIPHLLSIPAKVRFLSCEPLLAPVNLAELVGARSDGCCITPLTGSDRLNWVIAGGESGPGARPMNPDWARSLRDQCAAAGVPFLFKQWGEWAPLDTTAERAGKISGSTRRAQWHDACGLITDTAGAEDPLTFFSEGQVWRIGKKRAGRLLDGVLHDGYPMGVSDV